jgi:para-aminobenzoate synthetase component I
MFINRTEIIDKINHFSGHGRSFIFAIDFSGEKGFVFSPEEALEQGIQYDFGNMKNITGTALNFPGRFGFSAVNFESYKKAFENVIFHLKRGNTYLLNLTFSTKLVTDLPLDVIFAAGNSPYKLHVPGYFAIFSPELFIRIHDHKIYSCPMKGTIGATVPNAESRLLADKKELFEHNTIVDLIRNDLAKVSTGVSVTRFRYIDRIHTNRVDLLQMSSEISGNLPDGYKQRLGELLFELLPAGSVTGAPKEKTVKIIRETETYDRGFYTGIFGGFNGISFTSAVSIRFIENTDGGLVFKSGGGITALSDARSEYEELLNKVYVPVI